MRSGYCGLFVMAMGGAARAANPLAAPDPFEGRFVGEELSAEVREAGDGYAGTLEFGG